MARPADRPPPWRSVEEVAEAQRERTRPVDMAAIERRRFETWWLGGATLRGLLVATAGPSYWHTTPELDGDGRGGDARTR